MSLGLPCGYVYIKLSKYRMICIHISVLCLRESDSDSRVQRNYVFGLSIRLFLRYAKNLCQFYTNVGFGFTCPVNPPSPSPLP